VPGVVGPDWITADEPGRPARLMEWLARSESASWLTDPRAQWVAGGVLTVLALVMLVLLL